MRKKFSTWVLYWVCLIGGAWPDPLYAQGDCTGNFIQIFGSLIEDEQGYSLSASLDQKSIYVGGIKGDSAVLLNVNTSGKVLWTRSFDIVKGKKDYIYRVLTDSDGMIGISGIAGSQQTGGTVFIMRYDPVANDVLWAKELISTSSNFNLGMIEMGPGGNYLVTNNPSAPNVAELVEIDKSTGDVVTTFSKHYDLGSSESVYDMVYHNGQIYGSGRFSDGGTVAEMRNTLIKLDPSNGNVGWMKLGHRNASQEARFYGLDLVISQNDLFSVYLGDDNGSSITDTKIYVQRTDLNGNMKWIKQYELPGTNDWADEIIESNGGLVVLARNRVAPSDLILFKINYNGVVLWGKRYDYASNDNAVSLGSIQSQLIEVDGHLYFTAFAEESTDSDLILARTDLKGEISDTCASSITLTIPVSNVSSPVFYSKSAIVANYVPQLKTLSAGKGIATTLQHNNVCITNTAVETNLEVEICEGSSYEGYTQEGMYVDTFTSQVGCDSLRILNLIVTDQLLAFSDIQICPGQVYEGYSQPGIYIDTFVTSAGCDSVRTLDLSVVIPETNVAVEMCSGGQYDGYDQPGMYVDTIKGATGECDTIRHLALTVAPPVEAMLTYTICEGDAYFGYETAGIYTDTLTTNEGCDSVRTVNLQVALPTEADIYADYCEGYKYGYNTAGTYVDTLISYYGCDSIRTLHLEASSFYIPNVFSPNDDGLNDLFEIISSSDTDPGLEYFAIFDRYGNMTYETNLWPVHWNGTGKNGSIYNPGVYTYVLKHNCQGEKQVITGDITLIR